MAFFDDMASAMQDYPESHLDIDIDIDIVEFDHATGDVVNEGEEVTFKVQVTNRAR